MSAHRRAPPPLAQLALVNFFTARTVAYMASFSGLTTSVTVCQDAHVVYYSCPGEGVPFVLIHGIASRAQNFELLASRLRASGRPVVAIDLPGHGLSDANPGHQSVADLLHAVEAVLDAESIDTAHVIGHSLGGGLAIMLAAADPQRVTSLTLSASGGLGERTNALLRLGSLPLAPAGLRLGVNSVTVALARAGSRALASVGAHPYELSDSVLDLFDSLSDTDRQSAFMETLRDAVGLDGQRHSAVEALLSFDAKKVALVTCESDPVVPVEHSRTAHEWLPGSQLHVFAGKSHEPHVADAARFYALALEHALACESALLCQERPARQVSIPALARSIASSRSLSKPPTLSR